MSLQGARRAEVFQRTLEDVRRARADAMVLVDRPTPPAPDMLRAVRHTQAGYQGLAHRVDENHLIMGRELTEALRSYLSLLDAGLSELVLGQLLGLDDDIGRGALGRARRAITEEAQQLEAAIRRKMAVLLAPPRVSYSRAGPS